MSLIPEAIEVNFDHENIEKLIKPLEGSSGPRELEIMEYKAQLRYATTGELVMTGTSDGKGWPRYEFEPGLAEVIVESLGYMLRDANESGLYSKGSIGEVRDMLFAMSAVVEEYSIYSLRTPKATSDKAQQEAESFIASLPEGAVF